MEKLIDSVLVQEKYQVKIQSTHHQLIADEPEDLGGKNTGMTPYELLSASLAACTSITLKMYTERKQWEVGEIHVTISFEEISDSGTKKAKFIREISFSNEVGQTEKDRLKQIAEACPVSKILKSGENTIETIIK
ncbi:MAG: OsmC family protein [Raineya sp.]|jgi:putative redox protein|nr:OsmC family protein [Raineya sp.]